MTGAVFGARARLLPAKSGIERERERDVSAALTHLHTGGPSAATVPITSVPCGLTRKQPLFMRSGPLPNIPYKALEIDPEDQPKPDLSCPAPHPGMPLP